MSSSDSDDCYGNVTKKLQNLKNKYHEDQIEAANLLGPPKSNTVAGTNPETQQQITNSEPIVVEDLEDDDLILDQIIALNSIQRNTRSRSKKRASKSTARGNKSRGNKSSGNHGITTSIEEVPSTNGRLTRSRASNTGVPESPGRSRGRGRGRRRGGSRTRGSPRQSLYPTYSVGNTYEYPDQSHDVELFSTAKPKEVNLDDSITIDDNEELSIKVYWQSSEIVKFTIRKFQKLSQIYEFFANKANISIDKLLFTYNDKILKPDDTPDSINYNIAKFIDGGIVNSHIPTIESCKAIPDGIKLKFQCQNLKKPLEIMIRDGDKLQKAFVKCAEHLEVPLHKLKFEFDGDSISGSLTAKELELEGGECIDVKIFR